MHSAATIGHGWSDQVTSCIARRHSVKEVPLAGLYAWKLCDPGVFDCPFNEAAYRKRALSDNPKALTFHYITPQNMHRIHEMAQNPQIDDGKNSWTFENYFATRRNTYIRWAMLGGCVVLLLGLWCSESGVGGWWCGGAAAGQGACRL